MVAELKKIRIDKWLWAVRIYKTRTIATDGCKKGNIKINGKSVKPSYMLTVGETLSVHKNGFNLTIKTKGLLAKRVSAVLAVECYDNLTPESELNKYNDWFIGKAKPEMREKGTGRPTKRERREIDGFKEDDFFWEEE
jgi:ribosome-associated heat shock protein Hsp15